MNKKYQEDYFCCFKKIRNRLRKYSKLEIFDACMENLTKYWGEPMVDLSKDKKPIPINLFILMKWGLCYGDSPTNVKKNFSLHDFQQIYSDLVDLPLGSKKLNCKDPYALHKSIRAIAPDQFNFQVDHGLYGLALLENIINSIGLKYDTDGAMICAIGMPVSEFIDMQLSILKTMADEPKYRSYSIEYFRNLFEAYGKEKIQCFLDQMSNDFSSLVDFVTKDHENINNPEFEHALFTPLFRKPLYKLHGQYYPYHSALLNVNVEYGVYEILKKQDGQGFCSAFGTGFEKYIANAIGLTGTKFLREDEIRRLTHKDRCCDFLIPDKDSTVLIEVKSADMHFLTRQNPETYYLEKTLENSVVSGYQQIFTTAQYLKDIASTLVVGKDLFGIIITYKNLYLGNPEIIWNEFMRDFVSSNVKPELLNDLPLLASRIFVVSSLEFDFLLRYSYKHNVSLTNCLKKVEVNNSGAMIQKMLFMQNFNEAMGLDEIPALYGSFQSIMNRLNKNFTA